MNAKGQRKYMRAAMDSDNTATLNMSLPSGFVNGVIKDISVVGVSCTFEQDPELVKNALFKDIQVRLQTMLLKVEAIVFGSRMNGNEKIYVLLFTQRIDPEVRTRIRKYIQTTLQGKIDKEFK
jgi:ABC-type phosphate/phosphonate transport system substrate-binding protein